MVLDDAYLVGVNHNTYRPGKPGKIIGVNYVEPSMGLEKRLCFNVIWADRTEDWIPVKDVISNDAYKIIAWEDILKAANDLK